MVGLRGSGGVGGACVVVVAVAGASVTIGIEVVGIARVAFQLGLGRLLGSEAGAVVLAVLRCGGFDRVD